MGRLVRRSYPTRTEAATNGVERVEKEPSKPWRLRHATHNKTRGAALTGVLLFLLYTTFHKQAAHISKEHAFPIMVQSLYLRHALSLNHHQEYPPTFIKDRRNHYWLDHGTEAWRIPAVAPEGCIVLNSGYREHYPSCNHFHSIDMTDFWLFPDRHVVKLENKTRQSKFRHVGEGGFRNAFYISEYNGTRRVLKTLVWRDDRDFDISNMERNRKDSVIASQLTFSPLNADIYGYCAQSVLVDYSDDLDLYYLFDDKHHVPSRDELFDLAVDIAQSVADVHLTNDEGRATVVHMDLKPDQWIRLNGKYVLNDYNLAKFITRNDEKQEYCNQASGYSDGRWQAPEQFTGSYPRTEKADIFSLGYVLNFLLTRNKPFPNITGEEVMKHVMRGGIWKVPSKYTESTNAFDIALSQAITKCLKFKPEDRPSAQKVADMLRTARDKYKQEKDKQ